MNARGSGERPGSLLAGTAVRQARWSAEQCAGPARYDGLVSECWSGVREGAVAGEHDDNAAVDEANDQRARWLAERRAGPARQGGLERSRRPRV